MRVRWQSFKGRVWRGIAARLPIAVQSQIVIVEMSLPELAKAGLLETGRAGFLDRVYQVYWWIAVIVVLIVPTKPDQTTFYFPAVIGLTAAWLFAMPAYAQSLIDNSADFIHLRPGPTLLTDFIKRMRSLPVKLPPGLEDMLRLLQRARC